MGVLRRRPVEVQVRQVELSDLTSTLNSTSAKAYTHLSLLTATPGKGKADNEIQWDRLCTVSRTGSGFCVCMCDVISVPRI